MVAKDSIQNTTIKTTLRDSILVVQLPSSEATRTGHHGVDHHDSSAWVSPFAAIRLDGVLTVFAFLRLSACGSLRQRSILVIGAGIRLFGRSPKKTFFLCICVTRRIKDITMFENGNK